MDFWNKKIIFLLAMSSLVIIPFISFFFINSSILEKESVINLKVDKNKNIILIEGLCSSSAQVVKNIEIIRVKNEININVYTTFARKGLAKKGFSGTFKKVIEIDSGIQKLTFGRNKSIIWEQ